MFNDRNLKNQWKGSILNDNSKKAMERLSKNI